MFRTNLLLSSLLLLVLRCSTVSSKAGCTGCCLFVENVPGRLKSLRADFKGIRSYYEDNDELDSVLLDDDVLRNFKSLYGCHAVNDVLRFYHDTVLPAAMNDTQKHQQFKESIDHIGQTLKTLKRDILTCKHYLKCDKRFDIKDMVTSYNGMEKKGMYKAMGELDVLFNYIEDYMVSKRQRR